MKVSAAAFFITVMTCCFQAALANVVGNDTQHFNPTMDGLDFVTVESSQVLEKGIINTSFFVNEASGALPDGQDENGNYVGANNKLIFGDLSFAGGLGHNTEIGISFSYLMYYQTAQNLPGAQFSQNGLNEVRAMVKYNFVKRAPIGISGVLSGNFNQAQNNPFAGTGSAAGPTKNLEMVFDTEWNHILVAFNVGYRFRQNGTAIPGSLYQPLSDSFISSGALSYYVTSLDLKLIGEIFEVHSTNGSSNENGSEVLGGVKYDWTSNIDVQAGGSTRLTPGMFTPDWRIYAGVNVNFDAFKVKEKPPEPPPPAQSPPVNFRTALQMNIYKGFQPADIENQKDVPFDEMKKDHEFAMRRNVPDDPDSEPKPPFEVIRLDKFDFDFAKADIKPEYKPMLDKIAAYLKSPPSIIKLQVEGHTDSLGSEERNKKLSQRRAEAIRDYLVQQGVKTDQALVARGYGSDQPIAENSNYQGRTRNRRVEIRMLRRIPDVKAQVEPAK